MAISINWATKVIYVPQSFLTPDGPSTYELDVNAFRLALKDIEDSPDGMSFPDTHRHSTESLLSGTIYARQFEIINGYTITFEDVGTPYTVRCVGANHNIGDVKNVNQVSLIIGNSAGLIVSGGGGGGATPAQVWGHILEGGYSAAMFMRLFSAILAGKTTIVDNGNGTATVTFRNLSDTVDAAVFEMEGSERVSRVDNV